MREVVNFEIVVILNGAKRSEESLEVFANIKRFFALLRMTGVFLHPNSSVCPYIEG
jgi:hypothetical protein